LVLLRGFSFLPSMSNTEVQVTVQLDPNATFEETVEAAEQVNEVLREYDEFETVGVMVGGAGGMLGIAPAGGGSGGNSGTVTAYGVLKPEHIKRGGAIGKEVESKLTINGDVTVSSDASASMGAMLGDRSVQITLYGDDLKKLKATADNMAEKLGTLEGIDETDSGVGATSPELKVTVDRKKAAEKGLTTAQVFQQIAAAVAGEKTSTTLKTGDGKSVDIVTVKDDAQKITADKLGSIDLTYKDADGSDKKISLARVASIDNAETMDKITRKSQKRYLTVSGTIKEGYNLTDVNARAKQLFSDYELPTGFSLDYEGSDKETMEALQQLMLMMLLGVIMIYLIMVAQFQSLKSPFIIMFTIPLAFTGGFIGLLLMGFDISVISLVGFIMLCGIIVNNGIVLVDYINVLRLEGKERVEAIVEAGKTRMRPIFITALTTVLGLSVMALGIGTGAEMMQPMAIVCIGGLLYATLMTLFIIPLIYDAFNKKELRKVSEADLETVEE
ncbi:MAG: efflux RND transporter permease subunit, partial [Ruminococcus sp.]|nr:efflux RND transporter permease subunit [Ruminococcus sp.]